MLPDNMHSSTSKPLRRLWPGSVKIIYKGYYIYMVLASTGTSSGSMRDTTVVLDTGCKYNFIHRSELLLSWQCHLYPNFEIHLEEDTNVNLRQILEPLFYAHDSNALSTRLSFGFSLFMRGSTRWHSIYEPPFQLYLLF